QPPHLDPWVTWITVHTGVDRSVHGATVLEQDSATITAKRTWDYAVEAGKTVGVFGSIGAYPPRPVPGFIVPGPFAPSDATYPDSFPRSNHPTRRSTKCNPKNPRADSRSDMAKRAVDPVRLGLPPRRASRSPRSSSARRSTGANIGGV